MCDNVVEIDRSVTPDRLVSRSKNTTFENARFSGRAVATYVGGIKVHQAD